MTDNHKGDDERGLIKEEKGRKKKKQKEPRRRKTISASTTGTTSELVLHFITYIHTYTGECFILCCI